MNEAEAVTYILVGALVLLTVVVAWRISTASGQVRTELKAVELTADDLTDWYPPEIDPIYVGTYEVRMPWKSVTSIQKANWDGRKWCDINTGFECYFQRLAWRGVQLHAARRI